MPLKKQSAAPVPEVTFENEGTDDPQATYQTRVSNRDSEHAMPQMIENVSQKRRATIRRKAEISSQEVAERFNVELAGLQAEHSKEVSALRRQHLESLERFLLEKTALETEILRTLRNLQQPYLHVTQEIRCAVEGRSSEMARAVRSDDGQAQFV